MSDTTCQPIVVPQEVSDAGWTVQEKAELHSILSELSKKMAAADTSLAAL